MCKRNFFKSVIFSLLFSTFCVSVPENPTNDSDECAAYFLHARRQMKAVQFENRKTNAIVSFASLTIVFGFGYPGFIPLLSLPYFQRKNSDEIQKINEELEREHCSKTGK